jgi:hypothetical protein
MNKERTKAGSESFSGGKIMSIYRTIRAGERAAVWDRSGDIEFINGPRRIGAWSRTVDLLERHAAGADEYLVVQFKDGRRQHLHGPASVWFHPVEHEAIRVEKAIALDGNEALVVYSQEDAGRVGRRIVRGPALFMPAANEWLHEFAWHGSDARGVKVPRGLRFTKLRVIPDQMYFDVADVRTSDDALLVIQVMLFFELTSLETMLDQTHDPVADFINALSADVIDFAAGRCFEQFKEQTDALNSLETYPQLCQRALRIGYRINKVVYRGYHANPRLQAMHDGAIEARTKLRLEAETERQAQELADMRLQCEAQRAARQRELEEAAFTHQNRLKRVTHEEALRQQSAARDAELESKRLGNDIELQHLKESNRERLAFLQAMQGMQVDLTRYLIAQYQHPDRLIRIERDGRRVPQVHLHDG